MIYFYLIYTSKNNVPAIALARKTAKQYCSQVTKYAAKAEEEQCQIKYLRCIAI